MIVIPRRPLLCSVHNRTVQQLDDLSEFCVVVERCQVEILVVGHTKHGCDVGGVQGQSHAPLAEEDCYFVYIQPSLRKLEACLAKFKGFRVAPECTRVNLPASALCRLQDGIDACQQVMLNPQVNIITGCPIPHWLHLATVAVVEKHAIFVRNSTSSRHRCLTPLDKKTE